MTQYPGMGRGLRRHSEKRYRLFQGGFSPECFPNCGDRAGDSKKHCLLPQFPILASRIPNRIDHRDNSLEDSSS